VGTLRQLSYMKWINMSSPTPSVDSLSGAPTLGSFVDQNDLGLGLDMQNGCHGSSSSSSTCSSIVFPHLSIPNTFSSGANTNGFCNGLSGGVHNNKTEFNGLPSPTGTGPIKCGLCHETFTRPKVLPCLHTFCQDCLEKSQDTPDRLVCPSCRQECPLTAQVRIFIAHDFRFFYCSLSRPNKYYYHLFSSAKKIHIFSL